MGKRKSLRTISNFPEGIMHKILSLLEPKDAVMASLMCKSWMSAWLTKPNLLIKDDDFLENFARNDRTLLRYQQEKIGIDRLEIVIDGDYYGYRCITDYTFSLEDYINDNMDIWLKVAVANGVKCIKCFPTPVPPYSYGLHPIVFQAESLVDLQVICSRLYNGAGKIRCSNLKNLRFYNCQVHELLLEEILSSCNLIDNLYVVNCRGFNRLKVANPPKLKRLELCLQEKCSVEVESSTLECFYWKDRILRASSTSDIKDELSKLTLRACPNLKCLHLQCIPILVDGFFSNFACKFPQLEDLAIDSCLLPKRIRISSQSVKKINLARNIELEEVEINVPSLDCFKFKGKILPKFNFIAVSRICIYEIKETVIRGDVDG